MMRKVFFSNCFFFLAIRQTKEINCLKSEDSKPLRQQGHIGYSTLNPGNFIFPYPSLPWPRPAAKHSPLPSIGLAGLQPSLSSILLLLVGNRVPLILGFFYFLIENGCLLVDLCSACYIWLPSCLFFFFFYFVVSFVIVWLMHKKFDRVDEISKSWVNFIFINFVNSRVLIAFFRDIQPRFFFTVIHWYVSLYIWACEFFLKFFVFVHYTYWNLN